MRDQFMPSLFYVIMFISRSNKNLLQVCRANIEDFTNMDLEEKFIEIMKSKDDKIISVLGKYLHNCMIKRS